MEINCDLTRGGLQVHLGENFFKDSKKIEEDVFGAGDLREKIGRSFCREDPRDKWWRSNQGICNHYGEDGVKRCPFYEEPIEDNTHSSFRDILIGKQAYCRFR